MEASLKFYTEVLGLTIDKRYPAGPGVEITFLGQGETKLELICNDALTNIDLGAHVSTGFQIDNMETMIETLKNKGVEVAEGPFEPSPAIRYFFIKDPDGYKIQLAELNN